MPGKKNSKISRPSDITYYYDECLPDTIGQVLSHVGFPIKLPVKGLQDEDLIPLMGKNKWTWITKDDRAKTEHESLIRDAQISVIWIRGLSHEKRKKRGSMQRNASLKDVLRMLVNKLDNASEIIANSRGRPRYFLLYTSTVHKNQDQLEPYANLREVHERLAGISTRK